MFKLNRQWRLQIIKEPTPMNPLQAIRKNCIECSGGHKHIADTCHINRCPLHPFRMGTNPLRVVRVLSPSHREALSLANKSRWAISPLIEDLAALEIAAKSIH